jgi:hypothetical protein
MGAKHRRACEVDQHLHAAGITVLGSQSHAQWRQATAYGAGPAEQAVRCNNSTSVNTVDNSGRNAAP